MFRGAVGTVDVGKTCMQYNTHEDVLAYYSRVLRGAGGTVGGTVGVVEKKKEHACLQHTGNGNSLRRCGCEKYA